MTEADDKRDLRRRTKAYALGIVELYSSLPNTTLAQTLGKQVLRSGTSVGAQYRQKQETGELTAIFTSSSKTAKRNGEAL